MTPQDAPARMNAAADILLNGLLARDGVTLPGGAEASLALLDELFAERYGPREGLSKWLHSEHGARVRRHWEVARKALRQTVDDPACRMRALAGVAVLLSVRPVEALSSEQRRHVLAAATAARASAQYESPACEDSLNAWGPMRHRLGDLCRWLSELSHYGRAVDPWATVERDMTPEASDVLTRPGRLVDRVYDLLHHSKDSLRMRHHRDRLKSPAEGEAWKVYAHARTVDAYRHSGEPDAQRAVSELVAAIQRAHGVAQGEYRRASERTRTLSEAVADYRDISRYTGEVIAAALKVSNAEDDAPGADAPSEAPASASEVDPVPVG